LQEFGLGLAVAILVDATIVRAVLVPSLMAVLGRWNGGCPDARHDSRASSHRHSRRQNHERCRDTSDSCEA
jgi:RND superfamily putative drug exporter